MSAGIQRGMCAHSTDGNTECVQKVHRYHKNGVVSFQVRAHPWTPMEDRPASLTQSPLCASQWGVPLGLYRVRVLFLNVVEVEQYSVLYFFFFFRNSHLCVHLEWILFHGCVVVHGACRPSLPPSWGCWE